MLLLLISVTIGLSHAADVKWWEPEPYHCNGKVYYDAPMVWHFSTQAQFCLARRKGCVPSSIKKVYSTMKECHEKEFPGGKKTIKFMCEGGDKRYLWDKQPYVEQQGKNEEVCGAREKFCPKGYECWRMNNKFFSGCCSTTQPSKVGEWNTITSIITKDMFD